MPGLLGYPRGLALDALGRADLDYPHGLVDERPRALPVGAPEVWLDAFDFASDASTLIVGGFIGQWADKSGHARHAGNAGSDSNKPTYGASAPGFRSFINGIEVPYFRGSPDYLDSGYNTNSAACSCFVVGESEKVPDAWDCWLSCQSNGGKTIDSAATAGALRLYGSGGSNAGMPRAITKRPQVIAVNHDGATTKKGWVNLVGSGPITSTDDFSVSAGMRVGRRGSQSFAFAGGIAEVICYDLCLSDAEMEANIKYLMRKWGVDFPRRNGL